MFSWDQTALLWLNFDGGAFMDSLMWVFSQKLTWIPLYLLLLWMVWRRYGWRYALLVLVMVAAGVGLADQVSNFFKHNVPRFRPTHTPALEGLVHTVRGYVGGLYGTVSAHAATTFFIFIFMASIIRRRWLTWALAIWTLIVCYSRIYLGVHYPMQIFFGMVAGSAVALLWVWLLALLQRRFALQGDKTAK